MNKSKTKFSCIILAGGEGKRVDGRDKGLINYKGKTLAQHVINVVKPQVDEIIISANRNIKTYEAYGYKVVSDAAKECRGPLAGIAAALPFCENDWVLITPCDMPFLPSDIIEKLSQHITGNNLCIASAGNRFQLMFLVNKSLLPSILQSLQEDKFRLMQWVESQNPAIHSFPDNHNFKNFNNTKDLLLYC